MAQRTQFTDTLSPVLTNATFIPERLRELDRGYFVMYNRQTGQYELHHDGFGEENSLQCVFPYRQLDSRAVEYARRTHVSRLPQLLDEMRRHNAAVRDGSRNPFDGEKQKAKELVRYWMNHESRRDEPPAGAYAGRFV